MSIKKASFNSTNAQFLLEADYNQLLEQARQVSRRVQDRLRKLQEQFPSSLRLADWPAYASRREPQEQHSPPRPVLIRVWKQGQAHQSAITRAVDSSADGMSIWLPNPVQQDTLLEMQFSDVAHSPFLLEVGRCEALSGGWVVHCRFVGRTGNQTAAERQSAC